MLFSVSFFFVHIESVRECNNVIINNVVTSPEEEKLIGWEMEVKLSCILAT